jgi:hypothetical protein
VARVYALSLYWSAMTVTGIGYGNIVPVTDVEYVGAIVAMFVGASLWVYVIGNTTSLLSSLDVEAARHRSKMDQLQYFFADRKVGPGAKFKKITSVGITSMMIRY